MLKQQGLNLDITSELGQQQSLDAARGPKAVSGEPRGRCLYFDILFSPLAVLGAKVSLEAERRSRPPLPIPVPIPIPRRAQARALLLRDTAES